VEGTLLHPRYSWNVVSPHGIQVVLNQCVNDLVKFEGEILIMICHIGETSTKLNLVDLTCSVRFGVALDTLDY
jgi:hypothetical protein